MNEPHEPTLRKFNPGTFQPDGEVIRQFVVRQRELGIVLDVVRDNLDAPACQHVLLVAPRGRGKTMLLARAVAEVRTNAVLSERLVPVRFMEESQEVFDMGDFWLEALFHLAGETAKSHPDLSQELSATHADLANRWRGEDLEDRARAAVLDAADRLDKRLVLMVENLQTLSRDVGGDFGWKLRKTLQTEPRIMLLATATSRFAGLDDANEPFFELFRTVCLEPLDTEECRRVWQMVGGEDRGREIRPLQILTGGDPRLLVIVADFARHRSLRQLMEELVTLIDNHTEYFRGHLEGFAKTERRVYLAVIDLWRPSSTGEVAQRARLDVRSVSALLKRLVDRGAVIVEGSGRRRLYAATERLYSIYYKLRRQRDEAAVVRSLIDFMVVFYSKDELADMFRLFRAEAAQWPTIREGIERAMAESPQTRETLQAETLETTASETTEWLRDAIKNATSKDDFKKIIEAADRFLGSESADLSPALNLFTASILGWKALAHSKLDETKEVIATCDQVIFRFKGSDAPELQVQVANAAFNKGVTYNKLGRPQAAIAAYDTVVQSFGASSESEVQKMVAKALFNKGITCRRDSRPQAAIAVYDTVVQRFKTSNVPELQMQVAKALVNKGVLQGRHGRPQEALRIWDEIQREFCALKDDDGIAFRWHAMSERSFVLLALRRSLDAMKVFRLVYTEFVPDNAMMLQRMLDNVIDLIHVGADERDLIEIISSDEEKAAPLAPLVVALRRRAGEDVRAPVEVLEVAEDIIQRIEEKKRALGPTPFTIPHR